MRNIKTASFILAILLCVLSIVSCNKHTDNTDNTDIGDGATEALGNVKQINGISIEKYTVIYDADDVDYSKRAAEYISEQIEARTAVKLDVKEDGEGSFAHEIVVGETSRDISKTLDADTQNVQFAILADENHIALEGDYFIIAAAAYFFVETYVTGEYFNAEVPKEVSIHDPIVKEAKNYIMLIGDGMGVNHTKLFETMDFETNGDKAYSDGEDIFYGYYFPYTGMSKTDSLSGTTDSAAGGTALATGYKTKNNYVGRDKDKNDIQSLTELAGSLNMSTAVMSTDVVTGATPASFSAHADDRGDTKDITLSQFKLKSIYGTIIDCDYNYYDKAGIETIEKKVNNTLNELSKNKNGFFMMYEEAHIDKHRHNKDMQSTFDAVVRFNQVIGIVMEYAFYNPDTLVLITADHETGGLLGSNGTFRYTMTTHSSRNVPVFAYGDAAKSFTGVKENITIPKKIASLWGVEGFGQ